MKTITLTFDENELNAFRQLLDIALRQGGLGSLAAVSHFVTRLEAAQKEGASSEAV